MLLVGACAVGPQGELATDPALNAQRSSALLVVERSSSSGSPMNAQVGARFVQFTGVAPNALPDLLGTPSIPNTVGCSEQAARSTEPTARAEVRLLDVGALEVRSDGQTLALEPRRLPDLFRVVSGVVYAAEGEISGSRWQFRAAGNSTARIPAFEVEAQAPETLSGLSLAAQPLSGANAVRLPRTPFSLRWTRGDSNDYVVAHFEGSPDTAQDSNQPSAIVCSSRDDSGAIDIDANWAERIARVAAAGRVVIHRVRVRPFALSGVDDAAVVFDSSFTARLSE
jgi:hypothetical protein